MDADQLWETTLNPETRILKQIEIEDAKMASDITSMLMGRMYLRDVNLYTLMPMMRNWIFRRRIF